MARKHLLLFILDTNNNKKQTLDNESDVCFLLYRVFFNSLEIVYNGNIIKQGNEEDISRI